eukprot:731886-Rhodomonas_salina.1
MRLSHCEKEKGDKWRRCRMRNVKAGGEGGSDGEDRRRRRRRGSCEMLCAALWLSTGLFCFLGVDGMTKDLPVGVEGRNMFSESFSHGRDTSARKGDLGVSSLHPDISASAHLQERTSAPIPLLYHVPGSDRPPLHSLLLMALHKNKKSGASSSFLQLRGHAKEEDAFGERPTMGEEAEQNGGGVCGEEEVVGEWSRGRRRKSQSLSWERRSGREQGSEGAEGGREGAEESGVLCTLRGG